MTLLDIANKIDKSNRNKCYIDITIFNAEFNISFIDVEQDRLTAYWIANWYCTDSYVGYRMYFFDNIPVAVSSQKGRKYDEEFEWFSKDLAITVKNYLISIMPQDELANIKLCNIYEDIGDEYNIEFNNEILHPDKAIYKGEPVEIIEEIKDKPDWGIGQKVKIKYNNVEEIVFIYDLTFKFNLVEE